MHTLGGHSVRERPWLGQVAHAQMTTPVIMHVTDAVVAVNTSHGRGGGLVVSALRA